MADVNYLKDNLAGFIPQIISNEIIKDVVRGSSVLRLSKIELMQSDNKTFSVASSGGSGFWVGEAGRIGVDAPSWSFPKMEARKLAVIIAVTKEKLEDAAINVFGEIQEKISEAFYSAIDASCLFGTSSPFGTSVYGVANGAGMEVERGTNTRLDLDISDVMAKVEAQGYDVNGFVGNISFKNDLRKLRDGNGTPLYFDGAIDKNGNKYTSLYNLPIEFSRNGSWDTEKALLIAGDWNYSIVGIRENIQYQVLKEATLLGVTMPDGKALSLAENDLVAIKATMRLGFLAVKPAFALLTPKA